MKEVEIRAGCSQDIVEKLVAFGAVLKHQTIENDDYFKFESDIQRKLILRIRSRPEKSFLTFKGSSKEEEDIAWQEWETTITDSDVLKKLLLSNGMVNVIRIEKYRKSYLLDKFVINVDDIKNLGTFIEVEMMSKDVAVAREAIEALLESLGIARNQFITRGYVQLMLEKYQG
jgi:adenylate cyclase, class 2